MAYRERQTQERKSPHHIVLCVLRLTAIRPARKSSGSLASSPEGSQGSFGRHSGVAAEERLIVIEYRQRPSGVALVTRDHLQPSDKPGICPSFDKPEQIPLGCVCGSAAAPSWQGVEETHCGSPKNCNAEEGALRSPVVLPSMRG
jgi:hypothetical protein